MAAKEIKSMEINIDSLTAAHYVQKIEEMRQKLAVTYTRRRPVCTPVVDDKDPDIIKKLTWFDIVLLFNGGMSKVRLRLRSDQLYIQGFRVNDADRWFELGVEGKNKHLIDDNSVLLGYGHNYGVVLHSAGFDGSGGLEQVTVGCEKFINAARWLENPPNVKKRAEAILIFAIMLSESARFVPILNYLRRTWQQSLMAPDWLEDLIHKWGALCACVLFYDANPTNKWVPQKFVVEGPAPHFKPKEVVARSAEELSEYLGILQRDPTTIRLPKP